jgi:hypothetical protein
MRKIIGIIVLMFIGVALNAQPFKTSRTELIEVGTWEVQLDSLNASNDTLLLNSTPIIDLSADTISFVFELMTSDSMGLKSHLTVGSTNSTTFSTNPFFRKTYNKTDSIWAEARLQFTGPSGNLLDTTTYLGLPICIAKGRSSGPTVFGPNITRTTSSKITGILWIKINNGYASTRQRVKFKIWAVKRWA